jgi:folate-binding protein YgfZ
VTSPLLGRPGAVPGVGPDAAVALHYGDPLREQRAVVTGAGWVDRSNRGVVEVSGADRLSWLHDITSQQLRDLPDGTGTEALVLSPNGHVEQHAAIAELGGVTWLDVEPGGAAALLAYLGSMRFLLRVDPVDAGAGWATLTVLGPATDDVLAAAGVPPPAEPGEVVSLAGGGWARRMPAFVQPDGDPLPMVDLMVPRGLLREVADRLGRAGAAPVGMWAFEALRVAARRPRLGFDTDHRTLPHEVGWIGVAVHLDKGCYRGQETVARVHNLGRPPRRMVLLHLSGESEVLPEPGDPVECDGRTVGRLGTAVRHHELGQLALALLKRSVSADDALTVRGLPAVIDPSSDLSDGPRGRAAMTRPAIIRP